MAITANATTLTFNDATTQTTAGLVSGGALGTPSSGALTNCTSVPVNQATGTLPVANGGTGAATLTANNVLLGNGTSALQVVAPGSSGNILTSNGTTWQSTEPSGGGVTSLNGQTGAITNTTFNVIGSYMIASPGGGSFTINSTSSGGGLYLATAPSYDPNNGYNTLAGFNDQSYTGSGASGTWRSFSRGYGNGGWYSSLWVRIS